MIVCIDINTRMHSNPPLDQSERLAANAEITQDEREGGETISQKI